MIKEKVSQIIGQMDLTLGRCNNFGGIGARCSCKVMLRFREVNCPLSIIQIAWDKMIGAYNYLKDMLLGPDTSALWLEHIWYGDTPKDAVVEMVG